MLGLLSSLMNTKQEGSIIGDYLQHIKIIIDDLALMWHNLSDDEIVVHTLNGLGAEYKEFTVAIRARDSLLSFEELYDKLTDYETYLKREDRASGPPITAQVSHKSKRKTNQYSKPINKGLGQASPQGSNINYQQPWHPAPIPQGSNLNYQQTWHPTPMSLGSNINYQLSWRPTPMPQQRIVCQLCDKVGHSAKVCQSRSQLSATMPQVHLATATTSDQHSWVMDSSTPHHITSDLQNFTLHNNYSGNDDIIINKGVAESPSHSYIRIKDGVGSTADRIGPKGG
ncbi:hypothetical protein GW17_00060827 [Ensete ventricosum]|nr:hypothetical protein GW17_00060827 [Ensete ventricosum]